MPSRAQFIVEGQDIRDMLATFERGRATGKYWLSPAGELLDMGDCEHHEEWAAVRAGKPVDWDDWTNSGALERQGWRRLIMDDHGDLLCPYQLKRIRRAQLATLERIGVEKEWPVWCDDGPIYRPPVAEACAVADRQRASTSESVVDVQQANDALWKTRRDVANAWMDDRCLLHSTAGETHASWAIEYLDVRAPGGGDVDELDDDDLYAELYDTAGSKLYAMGWIRLSVWFDDRAVVPKSVGYDGKPSRRQLAELERLAINLDLALRDGDHAIVYRPPVEEAFLRRTGDSFNQEAEDFAYWLDPSGNLHGTDGEPHESWAASHLGLKWDDQYVSEGPAARILHGRGWRRVICGEREFGKLDKFQFTGGPLNRAQKDRLTDLAVKYGMSIERADRRAEEVIYRPPTIYEPSKPVAESATPTFALTDDDESVLPEDFKFMDAWLSPGGFFYPMWESPHEEWASQRISGDVKDSINFLQRLGWARLTKSGGVAYVDAYRLNGRQTAAVDLALKHDPVQIDYCGARTTESLARSIVKAELAESFLGGRAKPYDVLFAATNAGPFDGGCVVVAEALRLRFGGEVWVLVRADGVADHAVLKLGDRFADADGWADSLEAILGRFNANEHAEAVGGRPIEDGDLPEAPRDEKAARKLAGLLRESSSRFYLGWWIDPAGTAWPCERSHQEYAVELADRLGIPYDNNGEDGKIGDAEEALKARGWLRVIAGWGNTSSLLVDGNKVSAKQRDCLIELASQEDSFVVELRNDRGTKRLWTDPRYREVEESFPRQLQDPDNLGRVDRIRALGARPAAKPGPSLADRQRASTSESTVKATIPVIHADKLLHSGNLNDTTLSHSSSYEGPALSCALDYESVEAWQEIAEIGGGIWEISKPGGFTLADFHRLPKKRLHGEAVKRGLVAPAEVWKVTGINDDGWKQYSLYGTEKEARDEAGEDEVVTRESGWSAKPDLLAYWRQRHPEAALGPLETNDAAVVALLDRYYPAIDGVFWDDDFAPEQLSAPRVGLFQRSLATSDKRLHDEKLSEDGVVAVNGPELEVVVFPVGESLARSTVEALLPHPKGLAGYVGIADDDGVDAVRCENVLETDHSEVEMSSTRYHGANRWRWAAGNPRAVFWNDRRASSSDQEGDVGSGVVERVEAYMLKRGGREPFIHYYGSANWNLWKSTLRVADLAQFSESEKKFPIVVGSVEEDGTIQMAVGSGTEFGHDNAFPGGWNTDLAWRFRPDTGTLYWWDEKPTWQVQDLVREHLASKGYRVRNQTTLDTSDEDNTTSRYWRANGYY